MKISTAHLAFLVAVSLAGALYAPRTAQALTLKPWKDDLFSQQTILESHDGGAFETIDYQEMRDINGRDIVPERQVKPAYISTWVRWHQQDETLKLASGNLDVTRVGPDKGQAFTVIFIHGRGGDRRLGTSDYRFGGNFNRIKNLAFDNGGTYYAPSMKSFDSDGVARLRDLITLAYRNSGGKPVILSCASMGSFLCWGITRDPQSVDDLKGMLIMGGATDPTFTASAFYKKKLPLWFTHGSHDQTYAAADQEALFEALYKAGYPTRFTLFQSGSHGTPVRMTDWRKVINWILQPTK